MRSRQYSSNLALTGAILLFAQGAAVAQTVTQTPQAGRGLDDIVVTARRVSERLQDVPIAVSAVSGEALESRGSTTISDIGNIVPNVTISSQPPVSGSTAAAVFFIRGVGQTDFAPTTDPGVGVYLDGVYIARSVGSVLDLVDLERIEVLRGPQGTLFGKNTIGGAINITSREPGDALQGRLQLGTGSFNRFDALGTISGPLTEQLGVGLAVQYKSSDGYVRRLTDGIRLGGDDRLSARAQIVWKPTDALKVRLIADLSRIREESAPSSLLFANGTATFAAFWNATAAVGCLPPPGPIGNPQCYNSQWVTGNPRTSFAGKRSVSNADIYGASATVEYTQPWGTLKSITAYRKTDAFFTRDADGSPLRLFESDNDISQKQFSQELQYIGSAFDDRLKWVAGAYYFREKGSDNNNIILATIGAQSGGFIDNRTLAAFGQASFEATKRLGFTLGIRYTDEKRSFTPDQFYTTPFFLLGLPAGSRILPFEKNRNGAKEWTPLATASYKVTDDVLAYATYARGFKSGGFVQRNFLPAPAAPSYNPEFVDNYEIGLKSQFFGNRLRLNMSGFIMNYSDIQVTIQDGPAPQIRNAAAGRISGFELEAVASPVAGLRLEATLGYLDAKYTKVGPNVIEVALDKKFPFISKWSATLSGEYRFNLAFGSITPRIDWAYRSKVFFDAINQPLASQDGYGVLNASVSYRSPDDRWQVTLAGKNITDKAYLVSAYQSLGSSGFVEGSYGRPVEWSLRLSRRF